MSKIPVFYVPEQTAASNESFSPSAGKPAEVLASWQQQAFPIEVLPFAPVTPAELAMAHDPATVCGVLGGSIANGFGNRSADVARSLPYTSGSIVAAALHAFDTGLVAVSPTSGFHHAGYDTPSAFCTFNGLMVAVQALRLRGAKRIGILDCDAHYGNGTDQIIEQLDLMHAVRHWTFGQHTITPRKSEHWLGKLPEIVERFRDCDVLIYQAGADPHVDDPLGGSLTSEQMRRRDRIVFATAKRLHIPVAWNLAGGYQKPLRKVLDLHDATMSECVSAYLTKSATTKIA